MKTNILLLIFAPVFCLAQINADRPGEGISSAVVAIKTIQLESGLKYNRIENELISDHLIRFGVAKNWEVRLQTNQDLFDANESSYGFSSKYNFIEGKKGTPSLTLISDFDFDFSDYSFILTSDTELSQKLEGSAGFGYLMSDSQDFIFVFLGMGYAFNENWAIFAEYFTRDNAVILPEHGADFGITYLASRRLKLDFSFGSNLQNVSNQYFLSTGISYQFE